MRNKDKKKILYLVQLAPPVHGAAKMNELYLKSKEIQSNFDVEYVKLNYSRDVADLGRLNLSKFFGVFLVFFKILFKLIFFRPAIVYFTISPSGMGFLRDTIYVFLCKLFRKKIIYHLHGKGIKETTKKNKLMKFIHKRVFNRTKVIILSEDLYYDIKEFFDKKDVYVLANCIKNNVKEREFKQMIKKRKSHTVPTILFISNMIASKGPMTLLKACKRLKDKKIKFKCLLAGGSSDKEFDMELKNYVLKSDMKDEIKFLGFTSEKEKQKLLSKSDIFVFPTRYKLEAFSLVLLEAMQYGLPVIATDVGALSEIVDHEKTGFILKQEIILELTKYLKYLILKDKNRIRIGIKGREVFLKKFATPICTIDLSDIFQKVLGDEYD